MQQNLNKEIHKLRQDLLDNIEEIRKGNIVIIRNSIDMIKLSCDILQHSESTEEERQRLIESIRQGNANIEDAINENENPDSFIKQSENLIWKTK